MRRRERHGASAVTPELRPRRMGATGAAETSAVTNLIVERIVAMR
jgi:hypothetical protein